MISRTPRRAQDQNTHHQHHRKFGNIVNRMEKSMNMVPSKFQHIDKYQDSENVRPHLALYQKQEKSHHLQTDRTNIYNLYDSPEKEYQMIQKQIPKKQSINRNRQFVAKVDNINKMHDQISSMLKYIKNGQSKSLMKPKQVDLPIKPEDNIQRIIKERMREQPKDREFGQILPANRSKLQFQNEITPITQEEILQRISLNGDRPTPTPTSKRFELEQPHRDRAKINYSQNLKKPANNYLDMKGIQRSTQELSVQLKQASKLKFNYDDVEKQRRQKFEYRELSHLSPKKTNQKSTTPKKSVIDATPKKQIYNYDFSSRKDPEERIGIKKNQNAVLNNKEQKSKFDYDYEITKVKERIQSSEQMTKKMEQKYLGSHKKSVNLHLGSEIQTTKLEIQQSIVTRAFGNDNHKKERNYHDILPRSIMEQKSQKTKQFQLKVYPCNSPIHNERLKKDEACKLIAQKLSDQIKLDQQLRDARQSFNECQTSDKWKLLQQKLSKLGFTYTQQELQNQLAISSSQTNPFNNDALNSNNTINELAETFAKSQQFWQKKLRKFISKVSLQKSGFNVKEMDLDQRGYLSVEDLVCFINLHSSNFFRNRDIICLFRRMVALGKNRNGIQYDTFMNIVSQ